MGKLYSAPTLVLSFSASCSNDGGSRASTSTRTECSLNVPRMFPECSLNFPCPPSQIEASLEAAIASRHPSTKAWLNRPSSFRNSSAHSAECVLNPLADEPTGDPSPGGSIQAPVSQSNPLSLDPSPGGSIQAPVDQSKPSTVDPNPGRSIQNLKLPASARTSGVKFEEIETEQKRPLTENEQLDEWAKDDGFKVVYRPCSMLFILFLMISLNCFAIGFD